LKRYNFLRVHRRHNCSPAASFANCVMTPYLLKVHLQTFLSIPIIQKCEILNCDTLVPNERYIYIYIYIYIYCLSVSSSHPIHIHATDKLVVQIYNCRRGFHSSRILTPCELVNSQPHNMTLTLQETPFLLAPLSRFQILHCQLYTKQATHLTWYSYNFPAKQIEIMGTVNLIKMAITFFFNCCLSVHVDNYTIIVPTKCTSLLKAQVITICTFLSLYS
jgi:hypothetical protein